MNNATEWLKAWHEHQNKYYPIRTCILEAIEICDYIESLILSPPLKSHLKRVLKDMLGEYPDNIADLNAPEYFRQLDLHRDILEALHEKEYFIDARQKWQAHISYQEAQITRHNQEAVPMQFFGKDTKPNIL